MEYGSFYVICPRASSQYVMPLNRAGSFLHPSGGLIPPPFAQHPLPPASYLDNPPNISQGVLNIIITFAKYEQYLVYVMFIVDSDSGYLFI